jgi:glycerate 2-kinase
MPARPSPSKSSRPPSRALLARCLAAALAAVDGRRTVAEALATLDLPRSCPVLALGKAAPAMLAGASDARCVDLNPALCITHAATVRPGEPGVAHARLVPGDHPVPGPQSLAAGRALLAFLDALPPGAPLLCLLSGGSSALVEVLPAGVGVAELERANRWLLASGLPIDAINRVRSGMSCIKAGRLAARLAGRRVVVLAISDVPGDDPAAIGSGPWTAAPLRPIPENLPEWLVELAAHAPPQPMPGGAGLAAVDYRVIAGGRQALHAAGAVARAAGLAAVLHEAPLQGRAGTVAEELVRALTAGSPGFHGWYGETTVCLPGSPGAGGRNSHLALEIACALSGRDDITVLCAATDGLDGSGGAAGGWADGGVLARGAALGRNAADALVRADSGAFLAATGDALVTGPTGTNVMDLVLALRK